MSLCLPWWRFLRLCQITLPLQEYLWPGLDDSAFNDMTDIPVLNNTDVFALSLELYSTSPKDQKWGLTNTEYICIYRGIMMMTKWASWRNLLKGKSALQILWTIKLSNV